MEPLLKYHQGQIRQEPVPAAAYLAELLALVLHQEAALDLWLAVVAGKAPAQASAAPAAHHIVGQADRTEEEATVVEEALTSSGVELDEETEDRKGKEDVEEAGRRAALHQAGQAAYALRDDSTSAVEGNQPGDTCLAAGLHMLP